VSTIDELHRAVQTVLADHRLGQPVFVRYHIWGPGPPEEAVVRLAAVVRSWLGQDLSCLFAVAAADRTHLTVTLQGSQGGTALVSGSSASEAHVDLMVLGNHGALYQEDSAVRWEGAAEPADAVLREAVAQALRSDTPVRLDAGTGLRW